MVKRNKFIVIAFANSIMLISQLLFVFLFYLLINGFDDILTSLEASMISVTYMFFGSFKYLTYCIVWLLIINLIVIFKFHNFIYYIIALINCFLFYYYIKYYAAPSLVEYTDEYPFYLGISLIIVGLIWIPMLIALDILRPLYINID